MKTCIIAPCWLGATDQYSPDWTPPQNRLERNIKYLKYYKPLMSKLGADKIILYDNASDLGDLSKLVEASGMTLNEDLLINRFAEFLPRKGMFDYPYCWRVMRQSAIDLPEMGYEKIIAIDSDLFILNQKIIDYINNCNKGWTVFWDEVNSFPESAFQIINKDAFEKYRKTADKDVHSWKGSCMEVVLPYDHIEKGFHGGRFQEREMQPDDTMDYYGQCHVGTKVEFRKDNEGESGV